MHGPGCMGSNCLVFLKGKETVFDTTPDINIDWLFPDSAGPAAFLPVSTLNDLKMRMWRTVEPVYIKHSREMTKCSMYAGFEYLAVG